MRTPLTLLLVLGSLISSGIVRAQSCQPDSMYLDSTGFVFPLPYDSLLNPDGGIDREACINHDFEFTWTLKIPDTVLFPGIPIPIAVSYFSIPTSGAISNLPVGIDYDCNPPNCVFQSGNLGCVIISGVPTPLNVPGVYDLEFSGTLKTVSGASIPVTFPNPQLYPGHYYLQLNEENDPYCLTSTSDPDAGTAYGKVVPNPVAGDANLVITPKVTGDYRFRILDYSGRQSCGWSARLESGEQTVPLPTSGLSAGFWIVQWMDPSGRMASLSFIRD